MKKLNLKRKSPGHYVAECGNIMVTVASNYSQSCGITKSGWFVSIEKKTEIKKDFDGNEVQMTETLFYYPDSTKASVCVVGAEWIENNL